MKRFFSLILALAMVVSLLPAVQASGSGAVSSNIDDHFYVNAQRWTDPIKSHLAAEDGGYLRVEYIDDTLIVERYDANLNYLSGQEIPLELPVYGGVYICDDYNFVVVGQNNTEEDDEKEVFRIIRYTKDWKKVDHASLFGANTTVPFDAGCVRFDRSGDILYIRTCHKMYTADDGYNHQANVMIAVRISDMTVTDELTRVWNLGYGYVSHSFNQFVRVDGETLLAVDHGDYYPRSVVLIKYNQPAGQETFYDRVSYVNALPIVDSTDHYNDTGVSVGGFEFSSTDYLIAGCSYDQSVSTDLMNVHRNIFVTATDKDDFTDEATTVHWLTGYTADDGITVSPPHLVKVEEDRFFLTWTENGDLKYCFLDGEGQLVGEIQSAEGALSDCVPIVDGNRVLWYVTDNSSPVFYEISLAAPHEHDYSITLVTDPTCTEPGFTTYTCAVCGESFVGDYTDALGHTEVVDAGYPATCTGDGLTDGVHCSVCDAVLTAQTVIPAPGHSYNAVVTEPTCLEGGYTTYTCAVCGESFVGDYTAATGHVWDEGVVTKEPSAEESGQVLYTCLGCGETRTETLPPHVHDYSVSETVEPTCDEQGFTRHTCTGCGHSYSEAYVPALGHDWLGLRCTRCGETRENPFTDTDPTQFYFDPVLWAVENGVTTGATETTFNPNGQCQRAQVVTFLWRAAGKPEPKPSENPFVDVKETDFFYKAVLWAVEQGITNGMDASHFGPYLYCNRAQVVTFLWRSVGRPEPAGGNTPFADVKSDGFYYEAVLWAVENGVTNGLSATEFGINAICSRAQIVTFLYRTFA